MLCINTEKFKLLFDYHFRLVDLVDSALCISSICGMQLTRRRNVLEWKSIIGEFASTIQLQEVWYTCLLSCHFTVLALFICWNVFLFMSNRTTWANPGCLQRTKHTQRIWFSQHTSPDLILTGLWYASRTVPFTITIVTLRQLSRSF